MLDRAITITSQAFEGKLDKRGNFYIFHCLAVLEGTKKKTNNDDVLCAAVMHDLVEDFEDWTFERMQKEGFSQRTIDILKLMTHEKQVDYMDYIYKISSDPDATIIKMADLEHNSYIGRIPDTRTKDFIRNIKYTIAYDFLSKAMHADDKKRAELASEMQSNFKAFQSVILKNAQTTEPEESGSAGGMPSLRFA